MLIPMIIKPPNYKLIFTQVISCGTSRNFAWKISQLPVEIEIYMRQDVAFSEVFTHRCT